MSSGLTLRDQMILIREQIKEKRDNELTFSNLHKSKLMYHSKHMAQLKKSQGELNQSQLRNSQQLEQSTRMVESQLADLDIDNKVTQKNLDDFINHVNTHMKKLSDAVISMQSEIEMLRAENKVLTDYIMKNGVPKHQCQVKEEQLPQSCSCCAGGHCFKGCDCCSSCRCPEFEGEEQFEAEEQDICECEANGCCDCGCCCCQDDDECDCGCCQCQQCECGHECDNNERCSSKCNCHDTAE